MPLDFIEARKDIMDFFNPALKFKYYQGLHYHIPSNEYDEYMSWYNSTKASFVASRGNKVLFQDTLSLFDVKKLASNAKIFNQHEHEDIVFDESMRVLEDSSSKHLLTIADGGTFPCAFYSAMHHLGFNIDFLELLQEMVYYGYRKNGEGTKHSFMDIFVPLRYPICSVFQSSVTEFRSVFLFGGIVFALSDSEIFGINSKSSSCMVLYGIHNGNYVCSCTHDPKEYCTELIQQGNGIFEASPEFLNMHLRAGWGLLPI